MRTAGITASIALLAAGPVLAGDADDPFKSRDPRKLWLRPER